MSASQPIGNREREILTALVETYRTLIQLLRERDEDLAPYQRRNALKAVAALWQVMNGLDLDPEQIYDIGA